jgi:hypothetical protein
MNQYVYFVLNDYGPIVKKQILKKEFLNKIYF